MMKARQKRIRARVGDVFLVPVSDNLRVYGQVVDRDGAQFLVVVFRSAVGPFEDVIRSGIQLAGIVLDAKWRNGDWPIVRNLPPIQVRPPWFLVGHELLGNLRVVSFDSCDTRMVTPAEASKHRHRVINSPMVLQMAAQALHGYAAWREEFDHMRDLAAELSE
jgi:hypothetical protein